MLALRMIHGVGSNLCGTKTAQLTQPTKNFITRLYSQQGKETIWKSTRVGRRSTFTETVKQPGHAAFDVGKGAIAGGAVFGLGALCYYGMGLSNEVGTLEASRFWPQHVKDRIKDTYMYFGSSVLITAASAAAVFRSPALMKIATKNSWIAIGVTMAATFGTAMLTMNLEYTSGFGAKQLAWMLHTGVMGAVIAPVCLLGGPLVTRAALYTLGVVSGLSTLAVCAPSDKFLFMGGPLAIGLGVVFMSSVASMFIPPTTAVGASLVSASIYGGLLLFSGFMLYDTQRIIRKAENHPVYSPVPFDPINASIGIYLDTLNIFIRMIFILANSNFGKKK